MFELILHMKIHEIDVLCIQETWNNSISTYVEQGYVVVLSGSGSDYRSWAGVGFIISPRCRHRIQSYKQISDRLCSLRLKVRGGVLGVISAYAPHNLKPLPERFHFFSELDCNFRKCSANIGKFVFGDLNARVGAQMPGEDHIVGPHTFGRRAVHPVEVPNRDLLIEFCEGNGLLLANTFLPGPPDEKTTFVEAGSTYLGDVTESEYNMLDLLVCDAVTLDKCVSLRSYRMAALASDHFLVKAILQFDRPLNPDKAARKLDVAALKEPICRAKFAEAFCSLVEPPYDRTISNLWSDAKAGMRKASQHFPFKRKNVNQPWTSNETLAVIDLRRQARTRNDIENERRLYKEVKKPAKNDRTKLFDKPPGRWRLAADQENSPATMFAQWASEDIPRRNRGEQRLGRYNGGPSGDSAVAR